MKNLLLCIILLYASFCVVQAENVKGIMCTYDGSETTYAFTETPIVKYITKKGVQYIQLYVSGKVAPVTQFALAEGKQLVVTYAEFEHTKIENIGSDKVHITEHDGKKFISGGKLIIIKDGKKYTIEGRKL